MKIKNIFLSGRMNKDTDERLLKKDEYIHAENINVTNAIDSDIGVVKNTPKNVLAYPTALTFHGGNPVTIGSVADDASQKLYWYVATDTCSYICEYNRLDETASIILEDTRTGNNRVLRFDKNRYIHSAKIIIDTENERKFLVWTDGTNPPRKINIERAKTYGANNFVEQDISVIKAPPIYSPIARLSNSQTLKENYIKDKFIQFSYRFKYLDGEYSALGPFSNYSFLAKEFFYDYEQATNESMENAFNQVLVTFKTGDARVTDIELIYRESKSTTLYVVETFNKELLTLGNDEDYTFKFSSPKVSTVLASDEGTRLYDNVPLKAETMDVIGSRLVYANYSENYKLCHFGNEKIKFDFTVNKVSYPIQEGVAQRSIKSNRNYEVGLVYIDEYGRMSTVQTCEGNNVHIPADDSQNKNTIQLTINHLAPYWAKYYRAFVKETETTYDTITPVIFHVDAEFVFVKVEKSDVDKFKEGDFLVVKSDTSGILDRYVETKIIEFAQKERNFLDTTNSLAILQEEGTYIKLKPTKFSINDSNFDKLFWEYHDHTGNKSRDRIDNDNTVNYFEGPNFYETGALSQNDLIVSGSPSGVTVDQRFEVVVQSTTGSVDTFKWRVHDPTGTTQYTENVNMTTSAQALSGGLSVHFSSTTGHSVGDKWFVNGRTSFTLSENAGTQMIYKGYAENELIGPGSILRIYYQEYKGSSGGGGMITHNSSYTASKEYPNIEEFWHEVVKDEMTLDIAEAKIKWRRGVPKTGISSNKTKYNHGLTITNSVNDPLYMIIDSELRQTSDFGRQCFSEGSWNFVTRKTNGSILVFETKPEVLNDNIYYEIGQTYNIDKEGYHQGAVSDQTQNEEQAALVSIDWFNCFAWGNGVESFKHKDSLLGNKMMTNVRALTNYSGYRENKRIASLTYSGVYNQSTNYNALNEFNLSLINYRDLDDQFGKIMKIESRDTDLIVFQENKVTKILFGKSVLSTQDGGGEIVKSEQVLGSQVPFLGEYGISTSAASLAKWFNDIYFADERRGTVMRLGNNGLEEISRYGMKDWFRENIRSRNNKKLIGGYDPHNDNYILTIKDPIIEWREDDYYCAKGVKDWRPDKYYCKQDIVPIPVPVPVAPTFTCTTALFNLANGTTGDTISIGTDATVSVGTLNSVSPATYQSGSTTYTANITIPSGYANAGTAITSCTASATGTAAAPPPTPVPVPVPVTPTPPTPVPVVTCSDCPGDINSISNFSTTVGQSGTITVTGSSSDIAVGSMSVYTWNPSQISVSASGSTLSWSASSAGTAHVRVMASNTSGQGGAGGCCIEAEDFYVTIVAAPVPVPVASAAGCSDAGFTVSNGTEGGTVIGSVNSGFTLNSISPSTYSAGSATYTANITVNSSSYSNNGSTLTTCTATATGTAVPVPVPVPVPVAQCYAVQLKYNPLGTCSGSQGVYYMNHSNFCTATQLYTNSSCTTQASNGYYTTAYGSVEYRFWAGGGSGFTTNCSAC